MKTVLIANQKGGVGKTTIADQLVLELQRRAQKTSYANLDNQGGNIFESTEAESDTAYQIVDTPGALTDDFSEWCAAADVIIIPTLVSMLDRLPLLRCYDLALGAIQRAGANSKLGVVINCFDPRGILDREFFDYLKNTEQVDIVATLPRSVVFRRAEAEGVSISSLPRSEKPTRAFSQLVDWVME